MESSLTRQQRWTSLYHASVRQRHICVDMFVSAFGNVQLFAVCGYCGRKIGDSTVSTQTVNIDSQEDLPTAPVCTLQATLQDRQHSAM